MIAWRAWSGVRCSPVSKSITMATEAGPRQPRVCCQEHGRCVEGLIDEGAEDGPEQERGDPGTSVEVPPEQPAQCRREKKPPHCSGENAVATGCGISDGPIG